MDEPAVAVKVDVRPAVGRRLHVGEAMAAAERIAIREAIVESRGQVLVFFGRLLGVATALAGFVLVRAVDFQQWSVLDNFVGSTLFFLVAGVAALTYFAGRRALARARFLRAGSGNINRVAQGFWRVCNDYEDPEDRMAAEIMNSRFSQHSTATWSGDAKDD